MTTALVLGRLRPGRPIARRVTEVSRELRKAGWQTTRAVVETKKQLRREAKRAARDGIDVVVVVGGDGAVLQVATRLAGTGTRMGVIPSGTGNLLAGNLGLPTDLRKAVKVVLRGRTDRIDVGRARIGGKRRCFTVALGIGYDARVMDDTSRAEKTRFGQAAYLAHAWQRLGDLRNIEHVLELDGRRMETEAAQVFVANHGRMLPGISPREPVLPDDGLLDLILLRADGAFPGLRAGFEAMTQTGLGETHGGRAFRARAASVRIETAEPRLVELDGSVVGTTPVDVEVLPQALRIRVPR